MLESDQKNSASKLSNAEIKKLRTLSLQGTNDGGLAKLPHLQTLESPGKNFTNVIVLPHITRDRFVMDNKGGALLQNRHYSS